jgi:hypothetical protein
MAQCPPNKIRSQTHTYFSTLGVCELMGRVRNVVLIECTLDLGKPKKGRDFGWEGTLAGNEQGELVYKQPGTEVDDSCHSLEGSK